MRGTVLSAGAVSVSGVLLAGGPSDGGEMTTVSVSPGLPGFFAMFFIAAVVVLLLIDFSRRVRRIQARDRAERAHTAAQDESREDPSADERRDRPHDGQSPLS